jgi:hypothetical protein
MTDVKKQYIEGVLETLPDENRERALKAMKKYGNNRWWRSDDPLEVAKYQVFEDTLLVPFDLYHEGIEKLVGRPVYTHEFESRLVDGLREEAKKAIELREKGLWNQYKNSAEGKKDATKREMQAVTRLEEVLGKKGKSLICVVKENEKEVIS